MKGIKAMKSVLHNRIGTVLDTSDATATAADILINRTAYVDGKKITGTMPTKAAATITPSTANQTIAAGRYLSGTQTILGDADLAPANIKIGVNIFGVTGTYAPPMRPVSVTYTSNGDKLWFNDRCNIRSLTQAFGESSIPCYLKSNSVNGYAEPITVEYSY